MSNTRQLTKPSGTPPKKADNVSRTAAEEAVGVLLEMHERQRSGKLVDAEFVAMVKGVDVDDDPMHKPAPSDLEMLLRQHPYILKLAACGVAGLALYGLLILAAPLLSGYTVAGTATVNNAAPPGIELVFHAVPSMAEVRRVVAGPKGEFAVRLRRGSYNVTARSTGPARLATVLASPETTPISIFITKNVPKLSLHLPDARWQPGRDD